SASPFESKSRLAASRCCCTDADLWRVAALFTENSSVSVVVTALGKITGTLTGPSAMIALFCLFLTLWEFGYHSLVQPVPRPVTALEWPAAEPPSEAIVLGQPAAGAGKLTKLAGVDTSPRQSRREQGTDDSALVTTARLKANCGDCERAQPYDQLGPAGC